jgi:hypothetical protein
MMKVVARPGSRMIASRGMHVWRWPSCWTITTPSDGRSTRISCGESLPVVALSSSGMVQSGAGSKHDISPRCGCIRRIAFDWNGAARNDPSELRCTVFHGRRLSSGLRRVSSISSATSQSGTRGQSGAASTQDGDRD